MELNNLKNYLSRRIHSIVEKRRFGSKVVNEISLIEYYNLIEEGNEIAPTFFVSTGRTGTSFFTQLLNRSENVKAFHAPETLLFNPKSELSYQSKKVYEFYKQNGYVNQDYNSLISQIYLSNREDLLYNCFKSNKRYIETSNKVSFFIPALNHLFPSAKFVFVHRHPGEFVRSGIRRNWYASNRTSEIGRVCPISSDKEYFESWVDYDNIQKISWLWNETNSFIYTYLGTIAHDRSLVINFNKLSIDNLRSILDFIGIDDISNDVLSKELNVPRNKQIKGDFPKYKNWTEEDKKKVKDICEPLCTRLGYTL